MLGSGLLALAAGGISRLDVENSFLDYFAEDTEIYRGMSYVDQKLGGTTPFDVLIDFPALAPAVEDPAAPAADPFGIPSGTPLPIPLPNPRETAAMPRLALRPRRALTAIGQPRPGWRWSSKPKPS